MITPEFVDQPIGTDEHPVDYFWRLLEQLGPSDYPRGVVPVGEHFPGTAGFSAGCGLVRVPGTPMPEFPAGGIMFIAHNLHAEKPYLDWIARGVDPGTSMRYWQMLFRLLDVAEIDTTRCFFTNYFVGLKEGEQATGTFPGAGSPSFCRWSERFLDAQIRAMRPRVVGTFGGPARERLGWPMSPRLHQRAGVTFTAVSLRHPSAAISHQRRATEAAALTAAFGAHD